MRVLVFLIGLLASPVLMASPKLNKIVHCDFKSEDGKLDIGYSIEIFKKVKDEKGDKGIVRQYIADDKTLDDSFLCEADLSEIKSNVKLDVPDQLRVDGLESGCGAMDFVIDLGLEGKLTRVFGIKAKCWTTKAL